MQLFLYLLSGMANSVDPDQTAPLGAVLYRIYTVCIYSHSSDTLVYEILGHLL